MGLIEEVFNGHRELSWEVTEAISQCLDDGMGQGVALDALDALPKPLRRVIESV
jgi:hypothetical protein